MAEAAARAGDSIYHTSALAGFLIGTIIGAALIASVAFATFTCGFGAALVAGLLAGVAANGIRSLSEWIGSKVTTTTGKILPGGCSHNVLVNTRPAARAIISGAQCAKDMPLAPVAEGSSNVFINQYPAARREDKIQCGATIGEGSDNVLIGGGRVQYLQVKDEVPAWVRTASDIAFTVAGIVGGAAGAFKAAGSALNRCALKFVGGYVAGEIAGNYISDKVMGCLGGLFGSPVDVVSGRKILFDGQEQDFALSARLPLVWQRFYSGEPDEGITGKGWRLNVEVSLTRTVDGILYCGRTGQKILFPPLQKDEYAWSAEAQLYLYHLADGRHAVYSLDQLCTVFHAFSDDSAVPPEHIEDADGNFTRFHYDERQPGRLTGISDDGQNILLCHWHPTLFRLASVERLMKDGGRETLVSYGYDEKGNLTTVRNRAGNITRTFGYNDDGLMVRHGNIHGMQCFYRWEDYGENGWRVAESFNNEGEKFTCRYDFARRCTTLTDERGLSASWAYDEKQQVIRFQDFNQDVYRVDYNETGMPVAFHLPGDRTLGVEHDELNRIVAEKDPLGRITRTDYWLNTFHIICRRYPDGAVYRAEYDEKGHLLASADAQGNTTRYRWDERGLPVEITDASGGKTHLLRDETGNLKACTDCSGKTLYYEWNEWGELVSVTNMLAEKTAYGYSKSGEPESIHYADGTREHFRYYASGLLKSHQDTAGRRREWRYNRRGQPVQYTDRLNRRLHYFYDGKGNPERILNAAGGEYRFSHDAAGRLVEETRPDRTRRLLRYNGAGLLSELVSLGAAHTEKSPQRRQTRFRYDRGGRLLSRLTAMAEYLYDYDAADRLTGLHRQPLPYGTENGITENSLTFRHDKNGLLLEESCDGESLRYCRDASGNVTDLTLPDGSGLHWLYYGSGHASAVRFNRQTVTEFTRDDLHREISRTQGALTQHRGYDPRGRRVWQSALPEVADGTGRIGPEQGKIWRTFHFDRAGELAATGDAFRGRQDYRYDAESRLLDYRRCAPDGGSETFSYDAADNIFALPELDWHSVHGGRPDAFPTSRLPFWRHIGFTWDGFGNLTQKTRGGTAQYFVYDDENRLLRSWGDGPAGRYEARYQYDALGRRTAKTVIREGCPAETLRFRWQGMRLLQEVSDAATRTCIYDPDEPWTPLARITQTTGATQAASDTQTEYFHTDLNGAPLDVTDEAGNIVWCGKYNAWGTLRPQVHLWEKAPGLPRQPLRYAGQYCDDETGLHYNLFRYYDPDVGRFTGQDPVGLLGGLNLYQYAVNPLSYIDPLGLSCTTSSELNASGNRTGPRNPRIEGYNLKPGQRADLSLDTNGMVIPGRGGASTFRTPEQLPLSGHYHTIPEGTVLPDGIAVKYDGSDVGGTMSPGHATIYPTEPMKPETFIDLFQSLPWQYGGKK